MRQNVLVAKPYHLGPARRAVNGLVTPMLKLGIGGKSTYLLTTTGRRTGQPRTTPVILVENDADRWLVSPYGAVGWVHNLRAKPELALRRGNKTEALNAEEVAPELAGPVLQRYINSVAVTRPFFDATTDDPVERFVEEAPQHPVFRLVAASTD
jgi:deazaflavin-dependent oxidoreductase (nitroreductase family)